ncbi:MAG: thiamine ABC transporter substrate binding subunit [Halobacteriales archaeon]
MQRRRFLKSIGVSASALVAGCAGSDGDGGGSDSDTETSGGGDTETPTDTHTATSGGGGTTTGTVAGDRTLRVATYPSFIDAPSTSPGAWVKKTFESRVDATLKWFAPEQQMDYFIQRKKQGLTVDTDMFIGLVNLNLVHTDTKLGDTTLFSETKPSAIKNGEHIPEKYLFDTSNRVVPFSTSFISFVYNETKTKTPDTYEKLTKPAFKNSLIVPNPQNSETGEMFMLMTINQYGADGYLDYWQQLQDNGVKILGSWGDAYNAYSNGEAPIVVSYSTDQVFAKRYDQPMEEHQIAFPNGQGYAYIEGMAKFADTENRELADRFMEFILSPDVQQEIGKRNVTMPIVDNASLPDNLKNLVYEPETAVNFSYDELTGNLNGWLDEWSKQIAGK